MKSKNIPADISKKTIKEAQTEIEEIMTELENNNSSKEDSENIKEKYNRVLKLNEHIHELFKKKANEIKQSTFLNKKEHSSKN